MAPPVLNRQGLLGVANSTIEVVTAENSPTPTEANERSRGAGIAWDGEFLWEVFDDGLYRINTSIIPYERTFVGSLGEPEDTIIGWRVHGIEWDGIHLWMLAGLTGSGVGLYRLDRTNGEATRVAFLSEQTVPSGLFWDGSVMYIGSRVGAIYTLDLATGAMTDVTEPPLGETGSVLYNGLVWSNGDVYAIENIRTGYSSFGSSYTGWHLRRFDRGFNPIGHHPVAEYNFTLGDSDNVIGMVSRGTDLVIFYRRRQLILTLDETSGVVSGLKTIVGRSDSHDGVSFHPYKLLAWDGDDYWTVGINEHLLKIDGFSGDINVIDPDLEDFGHSGNIADDLVWHVDTLYIVLRTGTTQGLYALDRTTGRATLRGNFPTLSRMSPRTGDQRFQAVTSDGTDLYYLTDEALYTVGVQTGALTKVVDIDIDTQGNLGDVIEQFAYHDGHFYTVRQGGSPFYELDKDSGDYTDIGSFYEDDYGYVIESPYDLTDDGDKIILVGHRRSGDTTFTGLPAGYELWEFDRYFSGFPVWRYSVSEGAQFNLDLREGVDDATTFVFRTGYTPPSWLSIHGNILAGVAPSVNLIDDPIHVELTAQNSDGGLDFSVHIIVRNVVGLPNVSSVPAQFVDEGGMWRLDLKSYVSNHTVIRFRSAYTPPSWLTLDNNGVLQVSAAPSVISNEHYVIQLETLNANVNSTVTFSVQLTVRNFVPVPPTLATVPTQFVNEGESWTLDLTNYVSDFTQLVFDPSYTKPPWLTLTSSRLSVVTAPSVIGHTDFFINMRASNVAGFVNFQVVLRVRDFDTTDAASKPRVKSIVIQIVNAGARWELDLQPLATHASQFSFQTGYEKPDFLSLIGTKLIVGEAPTVEYQTDYHILLNATGPGGTTPFFVTLRVLDLPEGVTPQSDQSLLFAGVSEEPPQYEGFQEWEQRLDIMNVDMPEDESTINGILAVRAVAVRGLRALTFDDRIPWDTLGVRENPVEVTLRNPLRGLEVGDIIIPSLLIQTPLLSDLPSIVWRVRSISITGDYQRQQLFCQGLRVS